MDDGLDNPTYRPTHEEVCRHVADRTKKFMESQRLFETHLSKKGKWKRVFNSKVFKKDLQSFKEHHRVACGLISHCRACDELTTLAYLIGCAEGKYIKYLI